MIVRYGGAVRFPIELALPVVVEDGDFVLGRGLDGDRRGDLDHEDGEKVEPHDGNCYGLSVEGRRWRCVRERANKNYDEKVLQVGFHSGRVNQSDKHHMPHFIPFSFRAYPIKRDSVCTSSSGLCK